MSCHEVKATRSDGRVAVIPDIWIAGFCQVNKCDAETAIGYWFWQDDLESLGERQGREAEHWAIYYDAEESPEFPWFVEHHANDSTSHFQDDHEYGHFAMLHQAYAACAEWYQSECGED